MSAVEVFAEMKGLLDASMVKKVKAIFQWDIKIGDKVVQWTVDLKNGDGELYEGTFSSTKKCVEMAAARTMLHPRMMKRCSLARTPAVNV